jgi:hypothetical protein
LNDNCIEKDDEFKSIKTYSNFLNRFVSDIRYPHKYEVNEEEAIFSIKAVEKINELEIIKNIRKELNIE